MVRDSTEAEVRTYLAQTVVPAMRDVAAELGQRGVVAQLQGDPQQDEALRLVIPAGDLRDFVYGVRVSKRATATFAVRDAAPEGKLPYVFEPITFFADGREGYDIQYLRREEVIVDILRQYERYRAAIADRRSELLNRSPSHVGPL